MSLWSATRNVGRLIRAGQGRTVLRNLPYLIRYKWQGLDLGHIDAGELDLPAGGHDCTNTGGPDLEIVLKALKLPKETWALDVGCGKGGALFTLEKYVLGADGLEYDPHLCEIARQNRDRLGLHCGIFQGDARTFTALSYYDLFYLANPFDRVILAAFLANVADSMLTHPRFLRMIYRNPPRACQVTMSDYGWTVDRIFQHANHPIFVYTLSRS